jgi:hypothetical protein
MRFIEASSHPLYSPGWFARTLRNAAAVESSMGKFQGGKQDAKNMLWAALIVMPKRDGVIQYFSGFQDSGAVRALPG